MNWGLGCCFWISLWSMKTSQLTRFLCLRVFALPKVSRHERRISQIEQLNLMPLYPTEKIIWDENIVPTEYYSGEGACQSQCMFRVSRALECTVKFERFIQSGGADEDECTLGGKLYSLDSSVFQVLGQGCNLCGQKTLCITVKLLLTTPTHIHRLIFPGCLALPKLNLQFLTLHDYLLRNFNLFRLESTYEIRQDIEDVVWRMKPW